MTTPSPKPVSAGVFWPAYSLFLREWVRFLRQRNRMIGAMATPLLFLVFFGSGFGSSVRPGGQDSMAYTHFFFPGVLLMVVLFTAVFSSISIIEDRNQGFLQGVLVAPVSRWAIVLGKVLGSASLGLFQGLLLLLLAPLMGLWPDVASLPLAILVLFLCATLLSGIGFFFAWQMDSVQGFHAVMNLVLMPLWLLSGAIFPVSGASGWMQVVMKSNPLSYGLSALRATLFPEQAAAALGESSLEISLIVLSATTLVVMLAALVLVNRPLKG
ncbi:MAG: ABC transporter permease [Deltaproteobacteria bacterium]|nr:ABC transporter permease [Deltaproteobacteria bacterium]